MNKEFNSIVKVWEAAVRKSAGPKKRVNRIFTTPMSVSHVDDDSDVYQVEKILNNGDFYTGQWLNNFPNGQGKYLWTDGCMYVGEWLKGNITGKGRFSWPSGATYEGDFKNGFMDGKGTYIGCNGDTYKGFWVMDMKNGKGTQSYCNGDFYDGEWKKGLQNGHGRYQWKNGNHYIGQWRNGLFDGNGTLMWQNGNRYDGCWEEGFPKGNGTFRWSDGSFYVGIWSKDSKEEQSGTYYPSSGDSDDDARMDWDPMDLFSVDLIDCYVCDLEKVSIFPSQKNLNMFGLEEDKQLLSKKSTYVNGRARWMSGDERVSNYSSEDGSYSSYDGSRSPMIDHSVPRVPNLRLKAPKRQGETISKGHKNYELMLNLQLGIRYLS